MRDVEATALEASTPRRFLDVDELVRHLRDLARIPSVEAPDFTELDHGLQTAELLHQMAPDDDELIVAGLVHDLAHPWDGPGQPRHAGMGARAVREVLGERVASLILAHVPAKRYLVAVRPDYLARLSADSVTTLAAQGGPMSDAEVEAFDSSGDVAAKLALRIADDEAKVPGRIVPGLDRWEPRLRRVADRASVSTTERNDTGRPGPG